MFTNTTPTPMFGGIPIEVNPKNTTASKM